MNNEGSIKDLAFIITFVFVIAIVGLMVFKISSEFTTQINNMDQAPEMAKEGTTQVNGYFTSVIDEGFLFVVIGLAILSIALAALVKVHPVFLVFFIIALVILISVSMVLANVYEEMASSDILKVEADQLGFMSNTMLYLPWFVAGLGSLIAIIMYKSRGGPVQFR